MFPAGTNVEFAQVEAPDRVRILIWERGVGPTTSSGTGLVCVGGGRRGARRGGTGGRRGGARRHPARRMAGDGVYLTGWAELVLDGQWLGEVRGQRGVAKLAGTDLLRVLR